MPRYTKFKEGDIVVYFGEHYPRGIDCKVTSSGENTLGLESLSGHSRFSVIPVGSVHRKSSYQFATDFFRSRMKTVV